MATIEKAKFAKTIGRTGDGTRKSDAATVADAVYDEVLDKWQSEINANAESTGNKVTEITDAEKTSTTKYPSNKAVVDYVAAHGGTLDAVKYTAQTLNDVQKAQARQNIDARGIVYFDEDKYSEEIPLLTINDLAALAVGESVDLIIDDEQVKAAPWLPTIRKDTEYVADSILHTLIRALSVEDSDYYELVFEFEPGIFGGGLPRRFLFEDDFTSTQKITRLPDEQVVLNVRPSAEPAYGMMLPNNALVICGGGSGKVYIDAGQQEHLAFNYKQLPNTNGYPTHIVVRSIGRYPYPTAEVALPQREGDFYIEAYSTQDTPWTVYLNDFEASIRNGGGDATHPANPYEINAMFNIPSLIGDVKDITHAEGRYSDYPIFQDKPGTLTTPELGLASIEKEDIFITTEDEFDCPSATVKYHHKSEEGEDNPVDVVSFAFLDKSNSKNEAVHIYASNDASNNDDCIGINRISINNIFVLDTANLPEGEEEKINTPAGAWFTNDFTGEGITDYTEMSNWTRELLIGIRDLNINTSLITFIFDAHSEVYTVAKSSDIVLASEDSLVVTLRLTEEGGSAPTYKLEMDFATCHVKFSAL